MILKIKQFFELRLSVVKVESEQEIEKRLQLASAVLLFDVAQSDQHYTTAEKEKIQHAIESKFSLSSDDINELIAIADEQSKQAIDYHQFTSLLNKEFTIEQKIRLIELMWQVAFSDGELDPYEDHFIRKISGLLHLRQIELLSARERARP
ncbi:MAG: hypothetical protein COA74_04440 [Gammaproteobacteria bacterium]|nr:MAG: hypothetical protein COA74_05030 [Gammaproteobacteria bacterium]PCJ49711.1 MAG: hypothetical protein COA74_04440 [Gammaproteobacteria bacterium]